MKAFRIPVVCLFLVVSLSSLSALQADLNSVEITVSLRTDGKADVYYTLDWSASGGEMHGFYFEGETAGPVFNMDGCYADLPGGVRWPLSIKHLGGTKYDVILSKGKGFSGNAFYYLSYGVDFVAGGLMGKTVSPELGELVYIHWAPVEFDIPMGHRTVQIVFPIEVEGETLSQEYIDSLPFYTEPFVNEQNRIDFFGVKGNDGKYYLTVRFHQEDLAAYATQELEFYLKSSFLPLSVELETTDFEAPWTGSEGNSESVAGEEQYFEPDSEPQPTAREVIRNTYGEHPFFTFFAFSALIALGVFLFWKKARGYAHAVAMVEGIAWAGDNWVPPRLLTGSYQVPGKVAEDLHPVEVALLFELPLARVAAIMIEGLSRQGIISVESENPLKIKILSGKKAESEYEELFLAAFDTEGNVLSGLMADFFEKAIAKLQEKVWDCDIEATKAYYREKLKEAEAEEPDASRAKSVTNYYYWYSYAY
ncbi:MAG TPA: DUF2207 domain-containing protein, partial [Spirochaetia bacterium]|nr:DUF2207 domain-containing protein [Spirochaetia bacterium]